MKYSIITSAVFAALAFSTAAEAGNACYRRVNHPAAYGTFSRSVLVSPERTVFEKIPAQYATTTEQIMVRPAQTVPHHIPAVTQSVAEQVMVSPASKFWSVTRNAHGEEVGCWVHKAAVYSTQYRNVIVRPASTTYSTIPAEYRTITRQVAVSHERLVARTIPAVYSTQSYQAQVSPASASWQSLNHCN